MTIHLFPLDYTTADYRDSRNGKTDKDGAFEIDGVERIPQRLNLFGKKLVDATSPCSINEDALGNQSWRIEPSEASIDVTMIVE